MVVELDEDELYVTTLQAGKNKHRYSASEEATIQFEDVICTVPTGEMQLDSTFLLPAESRGLIDSWLVSSAGDDADLASNHVEVFDVSSGLPSVAQLQDHRCAPLALPLMFSVAESGRVLLTGQSFSLPVARKTVAAPKPTARTRYHTPVSDSSPTPTSRGWTNTTRSRAVASCPSFPTAHPS